jgi:hypothetical protein
MEFFLLGAFIIVLGLLGVRAGRRSYVLIGLAAVVTSVAVLLRT